MNSERSGIITFKGKPFTLVGPEIKVGDKAPDFKVVDNGLAPVTLASYSGKIKVISAVPSLDTPVCDTETRRFNQEAAALSEDIIIWTISTDLPPTQKRWCGAAGVDRVKVVSDALNAEFGEKYGLLIKERRFLRRAVFVVNRDGVLTYVAYMLHNGLEPDYDEVIAAAKAAL